MGKKADHYRKILHRRLIKMDEECCGGGCRDAMAIRNLMNEVDASEDEVQRLEAKVEALQTKLDKIASIVSAEAQEVMSVLDSIIGETIQQNGGERAGA